VYDTDSPTNDNGVLTEISVVTASSASAQGWSAKKDGWYVEEQHGQSNECYTTIEEAKNRCQEAPDCRAIATQSNVCDGKYRVTHGGPTFIYDHRWRTYNMWSFELYRGRFETAVALASQSALATITSCTASNNQINDASNYHCRNAFDGITTGTSGWAYSGFAPSWVNFVMSEPSTVSGLNILSGVGRPGIYRWTDFKISLKVGNRYIEPTNIRVANRQVQVVGGRISGVFYTNNDDTLLTITFDAVAGVTDVKTCVIVLPSSLLHAAARRARSLSLSLSFLTLSSAYQNLSHHPRDSLFAFSNVYDTDASNHNGVLTEIQVLKAVASTSLATITSCTASNNRDGMTCNEAFNSIMSATGEGWDNGHTAPSWANFQLSSPTTVSGLNIISGLVLGNDMEIRPYRWTDFKISLKVGNQYIEPTNIRVANMNSNIRVVQVAGGEISGVVYANNDDHVLKITFDAVARVTDVKTCVNVLPSLLRAAARRPLSRSHRFLRPLPSPPLFGVAFLPP